MNVASIRVKTPRTQPSKHDEGICVCVPSRICKNLSVHSIQQERAFLLFFSPLFANTSFHFHSVYKQSCNQYIKIMWGEEKEDKNDDGKNNIPEKRWEPSQPVSSYNGGVVILNLCLCILAFLVSCALKGRNWYSTEFMLIDCARLRRVNPSHGGMINTSQVIQVDWKSRFKKGLYGSPAHAFPNTFMFRFLHDSRSNEMSGDNKPEE